MSSILVHRHMFLHTSFKWHQSHVNMSTLHCTIEQAVILAFTPSPCFQIYKWTYTIHMCLMEHAVCGNTLVLLQPTVLHSYILTYTLCINTYNAYCHQQYLPAPQGTVEIFPSLLKGTEHIRNHFSFWYLQVSF